MTSKQSGLFALACCAAIAANPAFGQNASGIPRLQKQGSATQLIVDGKPFLALAGELANNAGTSVENMKSIWPRIKEANLNSVLVGVSWAQVEPVEGKFDFSVLDGVMQQARQAGMRMVLLWFGSWKNGFSSYAPDWVKRDFERFPRVHINKGTSIELLSTFAAASRDADAKAFGALMRHLRETDGQDHTVLMIQVENEVGVLRDSRDRSPAANKAFAGPVPKELMDYLQKHKDALIPEFADVWKQNGSKTAGTWEEVFGPGKPDSLELAVRTLAPPMTPEEHNTTWRKITWPVDAIFIAWQYAKYVNRVAKAGKAEYPIPLYANAWLQQPDHGWPGAYPSGGPLPQVMDIWKAGAPAIDILAPDLYLTDHMVEVCTRFTRQGNPLFIPETSSGAVAPANVLYAVAQHNAIGFSPFMIERQASATSDLANTYGLLANMMPLIMEHQGKGTMTAALFTEAGQTQKIKLGNYTADITVSRGFGRGPGGSPPTPPVAATGATSIAARLPGEGRGGVAQGPAGAGRGGAGAQSTLPATAILISTGPDEYFIVGNNFSITFSSNVPSEQVGLGTVEEGNFVDGRWVPGRHLAGDDTGQGEFPTVRTRNVMRVTLYRYH